MRALRDGGAWQPLFYRALLLYGSPLHGNLSPNIDFTMRINLTRTLALAAIFTVASGVAQAKVYKWVDQNGVTQYTQYPPPEGNSTEVSVPTAPSSAPAEHGNNMQKRLEAYSKQRETEAKDAEDSAEQDGEKPLDQEQLAADCQRMRDDLTLISSNPRLLEETEPGVRVRMTEESRQERIASYQQQLRDHCKGK